MSAPACPRDDARMLTDSHCHLDEFDDAAATLDTAAAAGVSAVVAAAQDLASMEKVVELKTRFPQTVKAALGLHPIRVIEHTGEQIDAALEFLAARLPEADELGEVGLDYKWADTAERQHLQQELLDRQLEIAHRCGKPACFHSRRSQRQVMERAVAYHRETGLNAQLHWFTQSRKLVGICNEEGIYVSVGPTILSDDQAGQVAQTVADNLLLLETDAPVAVGGIPGTPARARAVAEKLSDLRDVSLETISEQTQRNLDSFLKGD